MKSAAPRREEQLAELDLGAVADCLKVVAHPVRLRLIDVLMAADLTVGELALRLGVSQPIVSGHLRLLQAHGLIAARRQGRHVHYHVTAPVLADLCRCISTHFTACEKPR